MYHCYSILTTSNILPQTSAFGRSKHLQAVWRSQNQHVWYRGPKFQTTYLDGQIHTGSLRLSIILKACPLVPWHQRSKALWQVQKLWKPWANIPNCSNEQQIWARLCPNSHNWTPRKPPLSTYTRESGPGSPGGYSNKPNHGSIVEFRHEPSSSTHH